MRISDWSSDVCSSDLEDADLDTPLRSGQQGLGELPPSGIAIEDVGREIHRLPSTPDRAEHRGVSLLAVPERLDEVPCKTSEERRVGKECVSTCRTRWSPYN